MYKERYINEISFQEIGTVREENCRQNENWIDKNLSFVSELLRHSKTEQAHYNIAIKTVIVADLITNRKRESGTKC